MRKCGSAVADVRSRVRARDVLEALVTFTAGCTLDFTAGVTADVIADSA